MLTELVQALLRNAPLILWSSKISNYFTNSLSNELLDLADSWDVGIRPASRRHCSFTGRLKRNLIIKLCSKQVYWIKRENKHPPTFKHFLQKQLKSRGVSFDTLPAVNIRHC